MLGQTFAIQAVDYYYAKGIGMIEYDQGVRGKISLVSYTIK